MCRAALPLLAGLLVAAPAFAQTLADTVGGCLGNPPERTINADPSNYRSLLPTLGPGDRLLLAAGTYAQGLPIDNLTGQAGRCIVVEGPDPAPRAVFTGRSCCNTVSINNSSYVAIRNLDLDGLGLDVDAVKAESPSAFAHHITLENLDIRGHGANQQIVGINTKCPAWNWVVRRCLITGAGTGMYFGDSDGSDEFVASLVEHNLVRDTIGYNMQIKHQNSRATGMGIPASAVTIVRHNVFSKAQGYSTGPNARPNLLVGHWPLSGPGANDAYLIYGNFFHQNPSEALFQGTGHVALYANLFLNDFGDAANFQFHEGGSVRNAEAFHNTVVASGVGIRMTGLEAGFTQRVRANAAFSPVPVSAPNPSDNITDAYGNAGLYLNNPTAPVGAGLDLFPRPGTLTGAPADLSGLSALLDWDRDFNAALFDPVFRGAYSGEGTNPGWTLALDRKPEPPPIAISIADASLPEGDSGTALMTFTASLSAASAQTVTVSYATADGTATAGTDYSAAVGTVAFPPGTTQRTIGVGIYGDRVFEADETLLVTLSSPVGATLADGQAVGTILNDDSAGLTIDDVAVVERASGPATGLFTVTLAPTSGSTVTVQYQTADGTATAGSDYQATSGTLTFTPGASTQPVSVTVNPDGQPEGVETFFVNLSNASGATIAHGQGTGRIFDPGNFFTLVPCRLLDTRNPAGPYGGPALGAGQTRTFDLAGQCGIPAAARAISLNVTVTQPSTAGNLRLYPADASLPLVSSLNYSAGQTRGNNGLVGLSATGQLAIRCAQAFGTAHVIVDVNGYFE